MADRFLIIDDATGKQKRGGSYPGATASPTFEDFDVGGGGAVDFVSANVFTSLTNVDVYVNGQLMREGATFDFQRNVGLQKMTFATTVPQGAWVRIKLY